MSDSWAGDTWYPLETATCPGCGGDEVFSNGDVETCQECHWQGDITEAGS